MKQYRVMQGVGPISIRKSPDPKNALYEEWFEWQDGDVFTPPAHLKTISGKTLKQCVDDGHLEEVTDG